MRKQYVIALGGITIGLVTGFFLWGHDHQIRLATQVRGGDFTYINPLLECEIAEGTIDAIKPNFSNDLEQAIDDIEGRPGVTTMAAMFRDLNNGPSSGVNEQEAFFPASLLKLPLAMALESLDDDRPGVMERKVRFEKRFNPPSAGNTQLIPPKDEITVGETYTVRELVDRMLVHSDNQAMMLLYEVVNEIDPIKIRRLYRLLGVDEGVLNGPGATLSVKQYAAFFRILFNSSYIDHERSERLLSVLSQVDFKNGLVAGLPSGVPVAHKFGESGYLEGEHQIHDCGIVYAPGRPYLLCVMTRGSDIASLETSIADLSRFVYDTVTSARVE